MKFFFSSVLAMCHFISTGQTIANLDFENGGGKDISPWVRLQYTKPIYNISKDSTVKYQGRYSVRIQYDTTNGNSDGQILIRVPFDVNAKKIKIKGFARSSSPSDTVWVSMTIIADPHFKKSLQKGFWRTGDNWQVIEHEFDVQELSFPIYQVMINSYTKSKSPVWLDDFTIEADGKNIADLPSLDSRFNESTGKLTNQQLSNLEALGWIWGFLKYYHPAVAAGKYNWDAVLFQKIPLVKEAKNKTELSKIFSLWIDSLGEVEKCKKCDDWKDKNSVTYNIDLDWMKDQRFAEELQEKLQYLLENRHQGEGHYAKYFPVKNLNFTNENEYNWRGKLFPNEAFRLHFLFRYWNTIQYFSPYKNIIGRDWKGVLRENIPKFSEAKDTLAYHLAMVELVNSVNDSHSGSFDYVVAEKLSLRHLVAIQRLVGDTLVVTGFYNDSLAKMSGLKKGDIITHVNGRTVKDIVKERLPLINGGNDAVRLRNLNARNYITGGEDTVVVVDVMRNGEKFTSREKRYVYQMFRYTPKKDTLAWKLLDPKTGYVNMGILEKNDVQKMFTDLSETEAIIFDIRNYPKSTYPAISEHLFESRRDFAALTYPDLNYPGAFAWHKTSSIGPGAFSKPNWIYEGKVILIVNETTQSHAEYTTMAFQALPKTVTVGSQTSAADGNASSLYLPGNYFTYMTGLGVFYPDGTPTQRVGVKIDVPVKVTVKALVEGRDEYMEKVWEVLRR